MHRVFHGTTNSSGGPLLPTTLESDASPVTPITHTAPLRIRVDRSGDSVTVRLSGELDLASSAEVDAAIRDWEETEIGRIIVDLSDLHFIDSSGLNVLLRARRRIDSRLQILPSKHAAVTRLLSLTGTAEMLVH